jgi:hypothetical protein
VARFGTPGWQPGPGDPSRSSVSAARSALDCEPLRSFLRAITAPLTVSRALHNFTQSFGYTTMSFSTIPSVAATQLCGTSSTPATRP